MQTAVFHGNQRIGIAGAPIPQPGPGENEHPWPVQETPAIRRKGFYMVRTFYFPKSDYALNLALLRQHKAQYRRLVDAQFAIAELPQMFERFVAGDLVKPMLAFS